MEKRKLIVLTWLITRIFTAFLLTGGEIPKYDIERQNGWDTRIFEGTLGCRFPQFQPNDLHSFNQGTDLEKSISVWHIKGFAWVAWLMSTQGTVAI